MPAVPYLSYADAAAVLDWLAATGAVVVARQDGDDGSVLHSEVTFEGALIMIASDDEPYRVPPLVGRATGVGVYIPTDRVAELYDAALAAGATSVFPPEDTGWGAQRARVLDPGGREWSFGSYRPGGGA